MQTIRAFLCHSSVDKNIVIKVKHDLERRGILTWLDEFQIGIGESIRREIEQGISSSNFLIFFISNSSLKSEWVNREIDSAFMREVESKDTTIIPILIEECEIPTMLKPKRYIDLRRFYEKGINSLIETLLYPRRSVLHALVGRWIGSSGVLYLSLVGNLAIGKYDWQDQKSGNIFGHVEKNRMKFNWTWDYSTEHGMGIFDLDDTFRRLEGGWWLSSADIDPNVSREELVYFTGFTPWNFEKDISSEKGSTNLPFSVYSIDRSREYPISYPPSSLSSHIEKVLGTVRIDRLYAEPREPLRIQNALENANRKKIKGLGSKTSQRQKRRKKRPK